MKLRGLVPNFYIRVSESDLYISHNWSYLESLFSCIAWENSRLNCRSGEKGRELPPSSGWWQFPTLPSAPTVEPRVHINHQHTNFYLEKLWIINGKVVNFLFGLGVNEIPNKTFILDSQRPNICSVLREGTLGESPLFCTCKLVPSVLNRGSDSLAKSCSSCYTLGL